MRYIVALLILLAAPAQVFAFSAMRNDDCMAAWKVINKGRQAGSIAFPLPKDGWCPAPIRLPASKATINGIAFDRIEWRAEGIQKLLVQSLPPDALAIRITDDDMLRKLGLDVKADAPAMPMQIVLNLRQNAKDRQLVIENLTIYGPKDNLVTLQGVFNDVDLSSLAKMQLSLGRARLRDVTMVAHGNHKLESYLRPYFGATLPERSRKRAAMIDKVLDWPDHSFPPATKRAVQKLIASLPAPNGSLQVKVDMGAGLSAGIFMQPVLFGGSFDDMLKSALEGMVFHANWTAAE